MIRGRQWTGFDAVALQEAMRKSVRDFAALLGVETTTVTNWRSGLSSVIPRPRMQEILDTTLRWYATADDKVRFEQIVAEGEIAWRRRHGKAEINVTATNTTPAAIDSARSWDIPPFHREAGRSSAQAETVESSDAAQVAQGTTEELIDILAHVHQLSRSINPDIIRQLQHTTLLSIANYETLDPARLLPALQKQRRWLDELLKECNHLGQRAQLYEIASETSGLLGYIAVGRSDFPLARAYCLESFQLGDLTQNTNLMAWTRGIQSFCEYYDGEYGEAMRFAEDGMTYANGGPQSVRLAINGVARARGKLGDSDGVDRTVDETYNLMGQNQIPGGVPSSISLDCYSAAQVAGNAATAYLNLGLPDKVEYFAKRALPEMSDLNSPWGRSLVMIDLARSHVLSKTADLDTATTLMVDALDMSPGTPMMQVHRRASEFVDDAASKWGKTAQLRAVQDALSNLRSLDEQAE